MSLQLTSANQDQVAALAHKFWEDAGRPEGEAESHWFRAVETLAVPEATPAAKAKTQPKKAAKKA